MDKINPNQLCAQCKRPFKKHLKEGTTGLEYSLEGRPIEVEYARNYCFKDIWKSPREKKPAKYEWFFEPIDNLTLIEFLAKKRGITDNLNTGTTLITDNTNVKELN